MIDSVLNQFSQPGQLHALAVPNKRTKEIGNAREIVLPTSRILCSPLRDHSSLGSTDNRRNPRRCQPGILVAGFVTGYTGNDYADEQNNYQFADTLTWVRGTHLIKIGV